MSGYIYSKDQLIRHFKDYVDVKFGKFMIDYKARVYDKYIEQVNANKTSKGGSNSKGKGKNQLWLESLSDVEFNQLLSDIDTLKGTDFKNKYNKRKDNVKTLLSKIA